MAVATDAGADFDVVLYMSDRPDRDTLQAIVDRLEDPVENLVRKDSQFSKLGLNAEDYIGNPDAVIDVLLQYPRLLQRPVLVSDDRAIIGRPLGDAKAKDRLAEFLT
ncbi:MAG: arsenate reductase [Acidimicrobiaceae bacterium]|nr:arsenate reductase [Acidimicrobiaceae bacterium]MYE08982.1 arsenate reductase [Acidimicrobiaceae bacterium]MYI37221.1 arsenate reductase [Acidimicrobiaceae bacterium]